MIKITDAVKTIVLHDGYVIEGIQKGIINLSSYAKTIHSRVEDVCMKPVQMGSIVVALTRLSDGLQKKELAPVVRIDRFSVTSALCEITYERTQESLTQILSVTSRFEKTAEFFTITQGMHEITIICSEYLKEEVLSIIHLSPKVTLTDLVALSVRFSDQYIQVPNTIYSLVRVLALRHINIIEVVSTYTEITFVIHKDEMRSAIESLQEYSSS